MIRRVLNRFIDTNQKEIVRISKIVEKINELESSAQKFKDSDFPKKTEEFRKRIKDGESLNDILPEAFALVREASLRTIGLRQYDVQLIASIALFEGRVAEQKTGEGKTLSAAAPLYLRALTGNSAHLVTVNDYLARIGAGWNGPIYDFLGLSVGVIVQENKSFVYDSSFSDKSHGDERLEHLKSSERKAAYSCDITYGTNNEYGFDYLRDNMVSSLSQAVQRGHYFAIVDEVDSVLIDEARTPLIISAPDTEPTDKYYKFAELVEKLSSDTDYSIDEKSRSATLTEHGISKVEKILGVENLYEQDFESIHHIENALKARTLYLKDRDYVIKEGEIIIVDEFTGRLMPGRRWSQGIHQAVEAKEKVTIRQESKTLATISFQNYFRMYDFLAGMTGTAATEAEEFRKIYDLEVIVIPTHKPMVRKDLGDSVYKTLRAKYGAIVSEIEEKYKKGQPVLIGTTSIEKNEIIHEYLKRKKIPHNVLNAKNHEQEASIISDAGKPGAVTVATNMAGRGVDIVLGGAAPDRDPELSFEGYKKTSEYKEWKESHDRVVSLGGLHVIGTERHESRRIDNQLRGRAGRQGDPGSTKFYLSLEDDLMRIFGGEQVKGLMDRLKIPEEQPIENALVTRLIEQAQIKVEGFHFDIRKDVVEYDDVANQQREIIYKLRRRILTSKDIKEEVLGKLYDQMDDIINVAWPVDRERADYELLSGEVFEIIPFDDNSRTRLRDTIEKVADKEKLWEMLRDLVKSVHASREKEVGEEVMREIEKFSYLGSLDKLWIDHIDRIDSLRENVRLRAYGQKNPIVEFKNEAFGMFETLVDRIEEEFATRIFRVGVARAPQEIPLSMATTNVDRSDNTGLVEEKTSNPNVVKKGNKIGRNDPCWCGKRDSDGNPVKWKKCHWPEKG